MKNDDNYFLQALTEGQRNLMDLSLGELQRMDPNSKLIIQNNSIELQSSTEYGFVRAKITKNALGEDREINFTPPHTRETQNDFEKTVYARLQKGMTQQQVADATGISQSRVSQIAKKFR